jgi:hypothetical protein
LGTVLEDLPLVMFIDEERADEEDDEDGVEMDVKVEDGLGVDVDEGGGLMDDDDGLVMVDAELDEVEAVIGVSRRGRLRASPSVIAGAVSLIIMGFR